MSTTTQILDEIIHLSKGKKTIPLNIKGWKQITTYDKQTNNEERRILEEPKKNQRYIDIKDEEGKHQLIPVLNEKQKTKVSNLKLLDDPTQKPSPELKLYNYIRGLDVEFCLDQFSNEVAVYKNKYYIVNGREFKSLLAEIYFEEKGEVFNEGTWKKVLTVLNAKCAHKIRFFPLRCHTEENKLYYDDGELVWEFENGEYNVHDKDSEECPIIFRRYNHQLPANITPNEKETKELLKQITSLFNIADFKEECILPMFSSEHPQPMMLFTGDPGAAKSTFSLFIKRLVDPDQVERVALPDKNHITDFSMHRQHFYVILYDNIREIYKEQSDELCIMITGSTGIKRALYTNSDLDISKGLPRIMGNGLRPEPSNFNDLLDRTLLIDMKRIQSSRPEKEVWKKINALMDDLRFCCLRDVSKAIYNPCNTEEELPRMSEYCLIAESTSQLWKEPENTFIKWFGYRMDVSHATGMDDPTMIVLEEYLKEQYWPGHPNGIKLTGSDWRLALINWAEEKLNLGVDPYGAKKEGQYLRKEMAMLVKEKDFPQNANWMGRRFRDLSPLLKVKGYDINLIRTSSDRSICISKLK